MNKIRHLWVGFGVLVSAGLLMGACADATSLDAAFGSGGSGGDAMDGVGGKGGAGDTGGSGGAGTEPVARLEGLRVELVCTGTGSAIVNCKTVDIDMDHAVLAGDKSVSYDVTIRLRGLVEQKTYTNVTAWDGMWAKGGIPDASTFNIFSFDISSPPQTYYINAGSSHINECFIVDIEKTLVMNAGAVVTLIANAGGDALSTRNRDSQAVPIVVPGVPPYPDPFDGQFVQMDVVSIVVRP